MDTALITGASRGLGLALARELARRSWRLVIDARGADALEAARAELAAVTEVVALPGDVADPTHRRALVAAAGPRIDLLVNNASVLGPSPQPRLGRLPARRARAGLPRQRARPAGAVPGGAGGAAAPAPASLNVTSDAAVEAYEGWGGYGSSKAALEQVTRVLAAEHPELRIVAIDPGDMNTRMHQEAFPGEDISDRPPPEASVPGAAGDRLRRRRRAGATRRARWPRHERARVRRARRSSRPASATTSGCWSPRGPGSGTPLPRPPRPARARRPARRQHLRDPPRSDRELRRPARASLHAAPRPRCALADGHERWVIELREGDERHPRRARRAATRAARRRRGRAAGAVPRRAAPVGRAAAPARAAAVVPRPPRRADPLPPPPAPRPLADYQTIFATEPGSAEMPSAGRPFSERVLEALEDRGITVATVVLHTGVSSLERGERPYPERFRVPDGTMAAVRAARRVIAVGTTVVRALESAATRRHRGLDAARGRARARRARRRRDRSPAGTSPTPATC